MNEFKTTFEINVEIPLIGTWYIGYPNEQNVVATLNKGGDLIIRGSGDIQVFDDTYLKEINQFYQYHYRIGTIGTYTDTNPYEFLMYYAAPWCEQRLDIKRVIIDSDNIKPKNTMFLFSSLERCTQYVGLEKLNMSECTSIAGMFYHNFRITNFKGVYNWDTSKVKNMSYTFDSYSGTELLLLNWDTSKVEYMNYMFQGCQSLTNFNISSFKLDNCISIAYMFYRFTTIIAGSNIQLMKFIAPKLVDVEGLFKKVHTIFNMDLSSWDCPKVRNFKNLFSYITLNPEVQIIGLENFVFNQPNTIFKAMFSNANISASNLKKVELWNVKNVIDISYMFERMNVIDSNKIELNLSQWVFDDLKECKYLFRSNLLCTKINLSKLATINFISCEEMFSNNTSLTEINISNLDSKYIIDSSYMFSNNTLLTTILLKTNSRYENVVSSACMFNNCPVLTNVDVQHIVENAPYNLSYEYMYDSCTKLKFEADLVIHITIKDNIFPSYLDGMFNNFQMVSGSKPIYIIFHSENKTEFISNPTQFAAGVNSNFKLYVGWDKCTYKLAKYLTETFSNVKYYGLYDSFREGILSTGISSYVYLEANEDPVTIRTAWYLDSNNLDNDSITNSNVTSIKIKPDNGKKCTILNENLNYLFSNFSYATSIENFKLLSFPNIKSVVKMFNNTPIKELDLTTIDVTNIEDISYMLNYNNLTKLDISNWSPKHLKKANSLFANVDMTKIDVKLPNFSTWDMSNCEDVESMFYKSTFNDLDLSSWNMSKIKNASTMFAECTIKGTLNISNWDLASIENIGSMFRECKINKLIMDNFQISSSRVSNIYKMYLNATIGIDKLVLSNFFENTVDNGKELLYTVDLFAGLKGVKILDVSGWNLLTIKVETDFFNPLIFNFYNMFKDTDLEAIIGLETWKFNTNYVKFNIDSMFSGSNKLKKINGLQYGMFNITSSAKTFYNCSLLEEVSLPIMASNIESTSMFENCYNLRTIKIPYFSESGNNMFRNCYNLSGEISFILDIILGYTEGMFINTNKDSPNNLIISYVFKDDYDIPTKDRILASFVKSIENPETDKITMKLLRTKEFDISGDIDSNIQVKIDFRTKRSYISGTGTIINGLNMKDIQYYITYLAIKNKGIYLNVNSNELFAYGMNNIIGLDFLNTSKCIYMRNIFLNIRVKELDISMWNVSNVIDISGMFSMSTLKKVNISTWNTSNVKYINHAFSGCELLKEIIGINDIDVSNVIDANYIFTKCSSLIKLNLSSWKTHNLVIASGMFSDCNNLVELRLDNIDFTNTIDAVDFVSGCSLLKKLDLSSVTTNKCSNFLYFCQKCTSLEEIDLSNMQQFVSPINLIEFYGSFTDCYKLKSINLRNYTFEYSSLTSTFSNCYELREIIMDNGFIVKAMSNGVFENCYRINTSIIMYDVSFINNRERLFLEAAVMENSQIIINYPFIVENEITNFIAINKSIESRIRKGNCMNEYHHGGYISVSKGMITTNISNPYYTYTDSGNLLFSGIIEPYYLNSDEIYKNMGSSILNKINNVSIINLKSAYDNHNLAGFLEEPSKYSYELNKVDKLSMDDSIKEISWFFRNSTVKNLPLEPFILPNSIIGASEIFMTCIQLKNAVEFKYDIAKELNLFNSYYNCITLNTLTNYRLSNKLFSVEKVEYPEVPTYPKLPMDPIAPPREYLEYSHEPEIRKALKEGFRIITDENSFSESISTGTTIYNGTDKSIILSKDFKDNEITIVSHEFPFNTVTQLVIPNTITKFNRLYNDQLLTNIVFPNSVTYIGDNALQNNKLTSIIIPPNVTYIGHHAFTNNKITSVVIPSKVTFIGADVFSGNSITSLTISEGIVDINSQTFRAINLTDLSLPNSVLYIRNQSFQDNKLTELTLPKDLAIIGYDAFRNNLISSISIPNTVTSIDESAFMTNKLTSVTLPNTITNISRLAFADNLITNIDIPNTVTTINESAFMTNKLTNLVIYKDITTIKDRAFNNNQLKQIEFLGDIPPVFATKWIEKNIQEDGSKPIIQILVPRDAYKIYVKALAGKLPTDPNYSIAVIVDVSGETNQYLEYSHEPDIQQALIDGTMSVSSDTNFTFNTETGYLNMYTGDESVVVIPKSINGSIVKYIQGRSFKTGITKVVIPNTITLTHTQAFMMTKDLTSIVIPGSIINCNLSFNTSFQLESLQLCEGIETISGMNNFNRNQKLVTLIIPNTVKNINIYEGFTDSVVKNIIFTSVIPPTIMNENWLTSPINDANIQIQVPRGSLGIYNIELNGKLGRSTIIEYDPIQPTNLFQTRDVLRQNSNRNAIPTHYTYTFLYENYFGNCYELNGSVILDFDLSNTDPNFSLLNYSNEINSIFKNSVLYGKLVLNYTKRFESYIDDFMYCIYCHPTLTPFGNIVKGVLVD